MTTVKLAALLGLTMSVTTGTRSLKAPTLCSFAKDTVLQFRYSADEVTTGRHVPWPKGISSRHLRSPRPTHFP